MKVVGKTLFCTEMISQIEESSFPSFGFSELYQRFTLGFFVFKNYHYLEITNLVFTVVHVSGDHYCCILLYCMYIPVVVSH